MREAKAEMRCGCSDEREQGSVETFTKVVRVGVVERRPAYEMDHAKYAAYMRGRSTVDPPWWDRAAREESSKAIAQCIVQRGEIEVLVESGDRAPTHVLKRMFRNVTTRDGNFDVPVGPLWIEALADQQMHAPEATPT